MLCVYVILQVVIFCILGKIFKIIGNEIEEKVFIMNSEFNSRLLFQYFKFVSVFLLYGISFVPFYAFGVDTCPGNEVPIIADIQKIACATEDLQVAVQNDFLKKMAKLNYDASGGDSRDLVRGVEPLSSKNQDLTERVSQFHEDRISAGMMPYTVSTTAYPVNWKENSCSKKYKTIEPTGKDYKNIKGKAPRSFDVSYNPVKRKVPRSFEVRYNSDEEEFFMCENTDLSDQKRAKLYCGSSKDCKDALFISCRYADKKGAVTTDKACLSLDDYNDLSKELFLGSGWFSFSNPALEQNCPDGCSYYTKTVQRVFVKDKEACSDNYVIVHCGPEKEKSKFKNEEGEREKDYLYNLNIKEITNLCTDFDLISGCSVR